METRFINNLLIFFKITILGRISWISNSPFTFRSYLYFMMLMLLLAFKFAFSVQKSLYVMSTHKSEFIAAKANEIL